MKGLFGISWDSGTVCPLEPERDTAEKRTRGAAGKVGGASCYRELRYAWV